MSAGFNTVIFSVANVVESTSMTKKLRGKSYPLKHRRPRESEVWWIPCHFHLFINELTHLDGLVQTRKIQSGSQDVIGNSYND
jgi:hypothetical protein